MNQATHAVASTYLEWAKLHSQARYNLASSGIMGYPLSGLTVSIEDLEINGPTVYGYAPLLERLATMNGVDATCVVTAQGTAMANHLAMAAMVSPGDDVLVERPTYGPMIEVASYLRANILRFDRHVENDFQIDPDELRGAITPKTRLIVITNFHNPTGVLTNESTMAAIGEIATQAGARVLVDEVYLQMLFDQPTRSSVHLGPQFVATSSLTKAYGLSGLRCGWILAEPQLTERMWKLNDLFGAVSVYAGELLSVLALDQLDKIAARAKKLLDANHAAFETTLAHRTDLKFADVKHGTIRFPRLQRGSVDEFCQRLRDQYQTSVVPGRFFEMPAHFRIGLGGNSAVTAQGLEQVATALDRR
ncbi:MAG: aminotransferase class I/II-fold pyridoxal phosphate-dependent enzyme [Candidatus Acidiferrum sp.]